MTELEIIQRKHTYASLSHTQQDARAIEDQIFHRNDGLTTDQVAEELAGLRGGEGAQLLAKV
jgi:hypothetical protein